ncbi:Methyl-CpG-binding domain-containing protein 4 [Raphanus sativus]|uniref:Methyl-CpG-binding domain-containing protein 4 n=1 Tax=Raphanus sativus TaxID=3726 RepID=A0A6J0NR27_RAPSA|nr:methyl-CpG-binding domain-containing protein 4 [Raphanus sativus]KAJ4896457.1 Methyl-CpG-binding domain-containing protein 4 [Raphanus sativus]
MAEEENGSLAKPRAKKDVAAGRLIDTYAAQCENCHQWRVIDSQEEYEDIRSRMIDDPFTCDKKKQVSCEEPADLDYDSSRTWVIDKPGLPKTPKGFKRSLVLRKDYSKMDTYYFTPTGKKLRSRNEVASYVEANPEFKGAPLEDFSFTVPKVMEDTFPPDPKVASPPVAAKVVSPVSTPCDDVSDKSTKSKQIKGKFKLEEETILSGSPHVSPAP